VVAPGQLFQGGQLEFVDALPRISSSLWRLNRASARALSMLSPTDPIQGVAPGSTSRSPHRMTLIGPSRAVH
jgi:hypothetical protein